MNSVSVSVCVIHQPCFSRRVYSYQKDGTTAKPIVIIDVHDSLLHVFACYFYFLHSAGGKSKSVELEDVKFHQCVRLSRFENDRTISFIPPDGEFELMSYRLNTHVSVDFSVKFVC